MRRNLLSRIKYGLCNGPATEKRAGHLSINTGNNMGIKKIERPKEFERDRDGDIVLCAVSAYEEKYYFNPQFNALPEQIKEELRTISILFVEDVGGRFVMAFDGEDGSLRFTTDGDETDYNYDEIGAALLVKELQRRRQELFESLELFCRVVVLGEDASALLSET